MDPFSQSFSPFLLLERLGDRKPSAESGLEHRVKYEQSWNIPRAGAGRNTSRENIKEEFSWYFTGSLSGEDSACTTSGFWVSVSRSGEARERRQREAAVREVGRI